MDIYPNESQIVLQRKPMATLAVVEKIDGVTQISRRAGMNDLIQHHPKCGTCSRIKGIHGQEGLTQVFCQWWNKQVEKEGYCYKHTTE